MSVSTIDHTTFFLVGIDTCISEYSPTNFLLCFVYGIRHAGAWGNLGLLGGKQDLLEGIFELRLIKGLEIHGNVLPCAFVRSIKIRFKSKRSHNLLSLNVQTYECCFT